MKKLLNLLKSISISVFIMFGLAYTFGYILSQPIRYVSDVDGHCLYINAVTSSEVINVDCTCWKGQERMTERPIPPELVTVETFCPTDTNTLVIR